MYFLTIKDRNLTYHRVKSGKIGNFSTFFFTFQGKPGELEFYFRKIPLHQQKFLVVSILSNSPWLPRNLKNRPK